MIHTNRFLIHFRWKFTRSSLAGASTAVITEANRIHFVLFGMQDTIFGTYLAAIHRILIPVIVCCSSARAVLAQRIGYSLSYLNMHT
jgi:hypothetical protein